MFWPRREAATAVAEPTPKPPVGTLRTEADVGGEEEVARYTALCAALKVTGGALRMMELRRFLAKSGIPEYSDEQVHAHLIRLAKAQQKKQGGGPVEINWHPLRQQDREIIDDLRWIAWGELAPKITLGQNPHIYHELVPESVLETVRKISDVFPDASFYVTDIADVSDPFLAVTFRDQTLLVVEFWAEPGFRPVSK